MVLVFPCAGFQSEKGFQWDAENLGLDKISLMFTSVTNRNAYQGL